VILAAAAVGLLTFAVVPGPPAVLIGAAVLVGAARGAVILLQATLVADHWATTHYAALAGVLAAPVTIAGAVAPWASTALAARLDGSYPTLFHSAGRPDRACRHPWSSADRTHRVSKEFHRRPGRNSTAPGN
jgi:MFS family permease